jgi:hypothetical protein
MHGWLEFERNCPGEHILLCGVCTSVQLQFISFAVELQKHLTHVPFKNWYPFLQFLVSCVQLLQIVSVAFRLLGPVVVELH